MKAWIINAFAVTKESDSNKAQNYPGKLIREPFGFFTILENGEKVQIETTKKTTEPLFTLKDAITITPEWIQTLSTPLVPQKLDAVETTIGRLLLNLICLSEPFNNKLVYQNRSFGPSDIEKIIAPLLESTPKEGEVRKDTVFYVDEYLKFVEAVGFVESLSSLFTHSITAHGIQPAPGRKQFKAELLKRYEGKLRDPVEMAKFEEELQQFDNAYLKDDPAYGKFMKGKVKAARMSGFMTQGGESNNFIGSMELTPVVQALEDGIPLDPEGFTAISNTIRYGSFSRGAETVNGGVVAKTLMRAADNWRITEGDCGTKLGIRRVYGEKDISSIVGRYLLIQGKLQLIETLEQAKAFINQKIIVRSPQYCRRPGTQTCEVCAGLALSKYPTGLPIPLMELSGGILADSLKQMHNTKLETVEAKLSQLIS